ncbi:MAG: hypothetical protein PWR01_1427 [Clostridiales bacterium]|nr:hypothetical protein [Clostridiales bacterium]
MPGKVKCVVCGYPTDEDLVAQCPGCNNYVCDECADLYVYLILKFLKFFLVEEGFRR